MWTVKCGVSSVEWGVSVKYGVLCVECKVWGVKCGVQCVNCNVWNAECEV